MIELYRNSAFPMHGPVQARFDFTLFVGPVTCYYHNCGAAQGSGRVAAFCPSDVQMSLGLVEDDVVEAVGEVLAAKPDIESLVLLTACQSAFSGVDMASAARRIEERYGIVCLHRENNRILMPKLQNGRSAESGRAARRRNGGKNELAEMHSKIPKERVVDGRGLLFLGNSQLDRRNELFDAARQWGFDWVQTVQDWRSRAAFDRARSNELAIVVDGRMEPLAKAMQEAWGLRYVVMPDTCSIVEVDGNYAKLAEVIGKQADVGEARARALAAREQFEAAYALFASQIELSAPAYGVEALREMGVQAVLMRPETGYLRRPPTPQALKGTDRGEESAFRGESDAKRGNLMTAPALRSGDVHYPTSGPGMRSNDATSGEHGRARALPERAAFWGYLGIEDFFTRLAEELM